MAKQSYTATHPADYWGNSRDTLIQAANKAGVDVDVMVKIAGVESGYNPDARPVATNSKINNVSQFDGVKAISSAHGYGQFIDSTWLQTVKHHGEKYGVKDAAHISNHDAKQLRQNPEFQAAMLAEFTKENMQKGAKLGGPDAVTNAYLYHNLGDTGARKVLNALREHPDRPINEVLPANVIKNNPGLYGNGHSSVKDTYQKIGQSLNVYEPYVKDAKQHAQQISTPERNPTNETSPSSLTTQISNPQRSILDYATRNFSSKTHEYGREDMAGELVKNGRGNKFDGTRYNQDRDGDGRKGVDCSALVYYAMKGAGYNIEEKFPTHKDGSFGFTTHALFEGKHLTSYAEKHFDRVGSKEDLQPGDLVMFKTGKTSQHIGIYAGKDANGQPQFFGSQSSTGPALARLDADPWNKEYLGAIRPKDEFRQPGLREIVEIKPSLDPRAAAEKIPNDHAFAASPFLPERQYSLPDYLKGLYDQVAKYTSDYLHGMTDDQKRNVMTCMATQANEMKASKLDYVHQAKDGQLYHQWDEFKDARVDPHQVKEIPAASQVATLQQSEQARTLQESQQKQQGHRVMEV